MKTKHIAISSAIIYPLPLVKLRWKIAIGLVALCFVALFAGTLFRNSAHTKLEKYKSELRAQGEKLTFAHHRSQSTFSDESYARFLKLTEELRIIEPHLISHELPGYREITWIQDELLVSGSKNRLHRTNLWQEFGKPYESSRERLTKIGKLLDPPPSDSGKDYQNIEQVLGSNINFVVVRTTTFALKENILYALRQGDLKTTFELLDTFHRLVQMYHNEPTLVVQMIRTSVFRVYLDSVWEVLQHPDLSEAELKKIQEQLGSVNVLQALLFGLETERMFGAALFEYIQTNRSPAKWESVIGNTPQEAWKTELYMVPWTMLFSNEDELGFLQLSHSNILKIRGLLNNEPWPQLKCPLGEEGYKSKLGTNDFDRYRRLVTRNSVPNVAKATETVVKIETFCRMMLAAVALRRYELEHKILPANLEELVPRFLHAVPFDCMDGKPLKYQLNSDGTFLLYSVGEDGKNDGGDPTPEKPVETYEIWNGRDAVWPRAVE